MGISANRGTIYYLILCVLVVLTLHAQVFGVAEAYSLADLEGILSFRAWCTLVAQRPFDDKFRWFILWYMDRKRWRL